MDTKWKNIKYSPFTKGFVFILLITSLSVAAVFFINLLANTDTFEPFYQWDYEQSNGLAWEVSSASSVLERLIKHYKSEENVKNGGTVDLQEFTDRKKMLFVYHIRLEEIKNQLNEQGRGREISNYYMPAPDELLIDEFLIEFIRNEFAIDEFAIDEIYARINELYELEKDEFAAKNAEQIAVIHDELLNREISSFQADIKYLSDRPWIKYYVSDGKNVFTNLANPSRDYFTGFALYSLSDREGLLAHPERAFRFNEKYSTGIIDTPNDNYAIYFAFADDYLAQNRLLWNQRRGIINTAAIWLMCFGVIFMAGIAYLFTVTGRQSESKKIQLSFMDKIYTELYLVALIITGAIWLSIVKNLSFSRGSNYLATDIFSFMPYLKPDYLLTFFLTIAAAAIGLALVLSLIRNIKNNTFIHNMLSIKIILKTFELLKNIINGSPLTVKIIGIVLAYSLIIIMATIVSPTFIILFLGITIWFVLDQIKQYEAIAAGAEIVKKGNLDYKINTNKNGELAKLAENLDSISEGLRASVENKVKAERLKIELITNVSHDLKTPLTSIISYIDLLAKEDNLPEHVNDYIQILSKKAERLKTLIQDIFDVSKAASGNISLEIEKIDLAKLIRQTLADLDEKIRESGLAFKVTIPDEPVYINSDGRKLYRVMQNIIGNAIQYSLPGSRVYALLAVTGGSKASDVNKASIVIKNTANYEMTFTKEEILGRFARGEQSRTTEGSGLGLAIARSFTEICGGEFNIVIDGDLFKAELIFNLSAVK